MHTVDIEIFMIAQTRLNPEATRKWLDHVGATEYPVPVTTSMDELDQAIGAIGGADEVTDAGAVCGLCAKRCYMSFEPGLNPNVTRVRKVWSDYLGNILRSGHGSVTEHASWTFAIEGVSRVFTGEMNRHRVGTAISEGSMRYIRFDDIGFWMPISLAEGNRMLMPTKRCKACKGTGIIEEKDPFEPKGEGWNEESCPECDEGRIDLMTEEEFEEKKFATRSQLLDSFKCMEDDYKYLCEIWDIENMSAFSTKKKLTSLFRRIIGMGVATGGTWTMNVRALRHIITMRTSPHAEEEIAHVFTRIGKMMFEQEPDLFGDFILDEATGCWAPANVKI